jgi:hypothetical protein
MDDQGGSMHDAADYRARIAVINDDTDYLNLMRDLLQTEDGYEALICREWEDAHGFIKEVRRAAIYGMTTHRPGSPGNQRVAVER